jgi:hypothetical protein
MGAHRPYQWRQQYMMIWVMVVVVLLTQLNVNVKAANPQMVLVPDSVAWLDTYR